MSTRDDAAPTAASTGADDEPASGAPAGPRRTRHARRAGVVVAVLLVVLLALAGWVAWRGYQAATALQDARDQLADVDLDPADAGAATTDLSADLVAVRESTARARSATDDPVWALAEHVPWVGAQLEAVRVVSVAVDDLATDALPALDAVGTLLDGALRTPDGQVDVDALQVAADEVGAAAATTSRARAQVDGLDPDGLVGALAGPVGDVQATLAEADERLAPAAGALALLPPMLGADEPRTYLVLALNTAELRTAGGIVGSVTAVRADAGALEVVAQRSTADLPPLDEPVLPLAEQELAVHTDALGRWVQNATATPEFPRTAELVAARWARDVGGAVDGVVATDPVAVGALVGALGGVDDPDGGELSGDGLVGALLREAYLAHPDGADADAYFATVAASVLDAVTSGRGDAPALLDAVRGTVDERRVRVWSARPAEQEVLAGTVVGGTFLDPGHDDVVGLFLNDATQGKVGAYLATDVTFTDARCTGEQPAVTVVLDLAYDPPADVASFPLVVTGTADGVPVGSLATTVSVWSASGDPVPTLRRDGTVVGGDRDDVDGRTVQRISSVLVPGQDQRITVEVPLHDGAATVRTTPTLTSPGEHAFACGTG
ncbi:DUF4012 domain-containing protein [Cellulomonas oligotrophica]|uniref:DUF4012 domain-containing protein n=1 Tax=Cellulomonas oligotrophica TaxID=931536 RepID=A0A7Y9FH86_9CELL|nr:DUF4012 domain-containing protein [Cellulomonas oligotrophica]NYD87311.1 hypothetical protein [Cellulomonas oligotrophica]GIG34229.1 hypothetical protein Col01nite_33880 [Cellulomonas oligotrophica]